MLNMTVAMDIPERQVAQADLREESLIAAIKIRTGLVPRPKIFDHRVPRFGGLQAL
jgi:hypothetical protein